MAPQHRWQKRQRQNGGSLLPVSLAGGGQGSSGSSAWRHHGRQWLYFATDSPTLASSACVAHHFRASTWKTFTALLRWYAPTEVGRKLGHCMPYWVSAVDQVGAAGGPSSYTSVTSVTSFASVASVASFDCIGYIGRPSSRPRNASSCPTPPTLAGRSPAAPRLPFFLATARPSRSAERKDAISPRTGKSRCAAAPSMGRSRCSSSIRSAARRPSRSRPPSQSSSWPTLTVRLRLCSRLRNCMPSQPPAAPLRFACVLASPPPLDRRALLARHLPPCRFPRVISCAL